MRFYHLAVGLLSCISAHVFALNCPNPADFNHHLRLPPISYDNKTHQVKQVVINLDQQSQWAMIMHPVKSSPGQLNDNLINDVLNQLVAISPDSYKTSLFEGQDALDYCIYVNPQLPELNAIAYYLGDMNPASLNDDAIFNNAKINQIIKSMQLIK